MVPRRTRLALLLAAALAALTLTGAMAASDGETSPRAAGEGASIAVRARVDATMARLSGDDRRDVINGERTLKQRLLLAAVVVGVLCAIHLAWRRAVIDCPRKRSLTSYWSPRAGRSPPSSLSIA